VTSGRLDGIPRYLSYRAVRGYPLAVAVGTSEEHVLAEFRVRKRNYLAGASLSTVLILLFAAGLLKLQRRNALGQARYRESQAQFNQLANHIPQAFWIMEPRTRRVLYLSPAIEAISGKKRGPLESAWAASIPRTAAGRCRRTARCRTAGWTWSTASSPRTAP
jgi:hypothetical protein